MFIVHVLWSLTRGGAERMVFDLARVQQQKHTVKVISVIGGDYLSLLESAGIEVNVLCDAKPHSLGARWELAKKAKALLQEWKPDIVQTHLGASVWIGLFAVKPLKLKWLTTVHGFDYDVSWFGMLLRGIAYRSSHGVICVSESLASSIKRRMGIDENHIHVIPVPVDPKRFPQRPHGHHNDIPRIIHIGRFSEEKNHLVLFEALALIKRPYELYLIGDGPLKRVLQLEAARLGIAPRIHWVGSIDEPGDYLKTSDLFCFPSKHEGQGIALIEAMFASVPIVTAGLPAVQEFFTNEHLTIVTTPKAIVWKQAIEQALNRYDEQLTKAAKARPIALKQFAIESVTARYESLYTSL